MIELKTDELEKLLNENKKSFVMYGASWCGACKITKPKIKKLSQTTDIPIFYVDAEKMTESRNLAQGVSNLPTFVSFNGTDIIMKKEGPKSVLEVFNSLE